MNFKDAFKLMEQGKMVKLPSWEGYWTWNGETIIIHCRPESSDTGETEVDIRHTKRVEYTCKNIASTRWMEATKENTPLLGGTLKLSFEEALRMSALYGFSIKSPMCDKFKIFSDDMHIRVYIGNHTYVNIHVDDLISGEWELAYDEEEQQ